MIPNDTTTTNNLCGYLKRNRAQLSFYAIGAVFIMVPVLLRTETAVPVRRLLRVHRDRAVVSLHAKRVQDGLDSSQIAPPEVLTNEDRYAHHLQQVLDGCMDICDTSIPGTPSLFFDYIKKQVQCEALCTNPAIDAEGFENPPPTEIPECMRDQFSWSGRVPVGSMYYNAKYLGSEADQPVWTRELVEGMIDQARQRTLHGNYGPGETNSVLEALWQHAGLWGAANVLVIGSENPWVEACALQAGALRVTTLEYGRITSLHPQITTMTPGEMRGRYAELANWFDVVVTYSSVEHSGLGRYGDALNPFGDKQAIARAWCLSKPGARLVIGVPSGGDSLQFNAHRVYGPLQYPHLLANWAQMWRAPGGPQLVHVLRKPYPEEEEIGPVIWIGGRMEGQLGNHLFIAASSFGIARARGAQWCFYGGTQALLDAAVFFTKAPALACPKGQKEDELLHEGGSNQCVVWSFMQKPKKSIEERPDGWHIRVGTYLQAWPYFADAGLPFDLKDREWGQRWVRDRGIHAAIHIRKPEYGLRAPVEYFEKAIALLGELTKLGDSLRFVITTDDREWVQQQPLFSGMLMSDEGHSPAQDMAIIAACRHVIMSIGTYGWWGAYFGEPRRVNEEFVLYWVVTFNIGAGNHNASEFYLPHWIAVV